MILIITPVNINPRCTDSVNLFVFLTLFKIIQWFLFLSFANFTTVYKFSSSYLVTMHSTHLPSILLFGSSFCLVLSSPVSRSEPQFLLSDCGAFSLVIALARLAPALQATLTSINVLQTLEECYNFP
jgi:hypothetical protein